jgi:hypothetical protein
MSISRSYNKGSAEYKQLKGDGKRIPQVAGGVPVRIKPVIDPKEAMQRREASKELAECYTYCNW